MDADSTKLEITCAPSGRDGTVTLTVKLGAEVLAVEKVDITRSKARDALVDLVCKDRSGIDSEGVSHELLAFAAKHAEESCEPSPESIGDELDLSRVVRPERFIVREVSGIAIPSLAEIGGKLTGRWHQHPRHRSHGKN